MSEIDKAFTGSIAEVYETYFVPLIFAPYARDLAPRVAAAAPRRVLEVAAGTGVVTRALRAQLPASVEIVATDLNQAMLDVAAKTVTGGRVEWRRADATALPFGDETFDAVVCQFGVMFLPDKAKAFAELRRVLRPGGMLHFNVWDRIADNEFTDVATDALAAMFPDDPPRFMARTPHGYHDLKAIERDLASGGFKAPKLETLAERSRAASPRDVAIAYCQGTPLRNEIEAREASALDEATELAAEAIAKRFGRGAVDGKIQAHVVVVERDE